MSFFDPEAVFSAVEAISQELAVHSLSFLLPSCFSSSRIESFHPFRRYNTKEEEEEEKRDILHQDVRDTREEKMMERSITFFQSSWKIRAWFERTNFFLPISIPLFRSHLFRSHIRSLPRSVRGKTRIVGKLDTIEPILSARGNPSAQLPLAHFNERN